MNSSNGKTGGKRSTQEPMAGRGEGKRKKCKHDEVKPEIRGPKVLFGEANCDGVEEVKQPLRRSSGDLASDEILCIADSANQLPHQRHCCLKHAFGSGNNHVFCESCYCFVCDTKASRCAEWNIHCNASPSPRWLKERWLWLNPVQRCLSSLDPNVLDNTGEKQRTLCENEAYELFSSERKGMEYRFRAYEAGKEEEVNGSKVLYHDFEQVKQFSKERRPSFDGKKETRWVEKVVVLDALTDVIVKKTWRPPKYCSPGDVWEIEAAEKYKKMMLSFGSCWILAVARCGLAHRRAFCEAIHQRFTRLKTLAEEKTLFDCGFKLLLEMTMYTRNTCHASEITLSACYQLYKCSIRLRQTNIVAKQIEKEVDNDIGRSIVWQQIVRKGSHHAPLLEFLKQSAIQMPAIYVFARKLNSELIKHIGSYMYVQVGGKFVFPKQTLIRRCEEEGKLYKLYICPCSEHWRDCFNMNFTSTRTWQKEASLCNYFSSMIEKKYVFSTKRSKRFEEIMKCTLCFITAGIMNGGLVHRTFNRWFEMCKRGIDMLLELLETPTPTLQSLIYEFGVGVTEILLAFASIDIYVANNVEKKMYKLWKPLLRLFHIGWAIAGHKERKVNVLDQLIAICENEDRRGSIVTAFKEIASITHSLLKLTEKPYADGESQVCLVHDVLDSHTEESFNRSKPRFEEYANVFGFEIQFLRSRVLLIKRKTDK